MSLSNLHNMAKSKQSSIDVWQEIGILFQEGYTQRHIATNLIHLEGNQCHSLLQKTDLDYKVFGGVYIYKKKCNGS